MGGIFVVWGIATIIRVSAMSLVVSCISPQLRVKLYDTVLRKYLAFLKSEEAESLSIGYRMTCFQYHARWPNIWQTWFNLVSQWQARWTSLCSRRLCSHLSRSFIYLRSVFPTEYFGGNLRKYFRKPVDALTIATQVAAELTLMFMTLKKRK